MASNPASLQWSLIWPGFFAVIARWYINFMSVAYFCSWWSLHFVI
jgi:hypothetical protein